MCYLLQTICAYWTWIWSLILGNTVVVVRELVSKYRQLQLMHTHKRTLAYHVSFAIYILVLYKRLWYVCASVKQFTVVHTWEPSKDTLIRVFNNRHDLLIIKARLFLFQEGKSNPCRRGWWFTYRRPPCLKYGWYK